MWPISVGVVGVGYLGAHHAAAYRDLPEAKLVGVMDLVRVRGRSVAERLGCRSFHDLGELLNSVEAVSVAVPTTAHTTVVEQALEAGVHVLVEKPMAATVEEATRMAQHAASKGLALQVGHLERFNPAFVAVKDKIRRPAFIESHRLSEFAARGTDVPVVLDLMVHDVDLVLWAVGSEPEAVDAVGVPILSEQEDIANARLTFSCGTVANLTVSRVSREKMRKIRFFQKDAYLSLDLLERKVSMFCRGSRGIEPVTVRVEEYDPLRRELSSFLHAVKSGEQPEVDGQAGVRALRVATAVMAAARARKEAISKYWEQR